MKFKLSEFIQTEREKPKTSVKASNFQILKRLQYTIDIEFNLTTNISNISKWLETLETLDTHMLEFESSTIVGSLIKSFTIKLESNDMKYQTIRELLSSQINDKFDFKVTDFISVQYDMISVISKPLVIKAIKHPLMNRNIVISEFGIHDEYYLMLIQISKFEWIIDTQGSDVYLKSINISSTNSNSISHDNNIPISQDVFNLPNNQKIPTSEYDGKSKTFSTAVNGIKYKIDISSCPFLIKLFDVHLTPNSEEWFIKNNIKNNQLQVTSTSFQIEKNMKSKMDKFVNTTKKKVTN